jgi:hypothetical protein
MPPPDAKEGQRCVQKGRCVRSDASAQNARAMRAASAPSAMRFAHAATDAAQHAVCRDARRVLLRERDMAMLMPTRREERLQMRYRFRHFAAAAGAIHAPR